MPFMHVRKPLSQWSMSSQIHGPRSLKIPRPAQVGGMVIVKTLASRWLILRVYLFLQGFAHRPYSWIPVKQFTLVAEKGTVQTPYFPVIRSMEKSKNWWINQCVPRVFNNWQRTAKSARAGDLNPEPRRPCAQEVNSRWPYLPNMCGQHLKASKGPSGIFWCSSRATTRQAYSHCSMSFPLAYRNRFHCCCRLSKYPFGGLYSLLSGVR